MPLTWNLHTHTTSTPNYHHRHPQDVFSPKCLQSSPHTPTLWHNTLPEIRIGIPFSKIQLFPFDSPAPDYSAHKSPESLFIIFSFNLYFLLFIFVVCTYIPLQYSHFIINFSLLLIQPLMNVINLNCFKHATQYILYIWPHLTPEQFSKRERTTVLWITQTSFILVPSFINYTSLCSLCITVNPVCENSILRVTC